MFFLRCNAAGYAAGLGSNPIKHRFISLGFIPDKYSLTSKARVWEFSKSGGAFLLLMKTVGAVLLHRLSFFYRCNAWA
jgi:hypothetical protein